MNGVFELYLGQDGSSLRHSMYFLGTVLAAAASFVLFIKTKKSTVYAYTVFLVTEILHLALSIASSGGMLSLGSADMVFYGVSDIIYVFLFVAAAALCASQPGKKVFISFACVFCLAIAGGFGLSAFLFARYREVYNLACSLVSLLLVAGSIALAPVLIGLENKRGLLRAQSAAPEGGKQEGEQLRMERFYAADLRAGK
jgi:hypothetical protein